MGKTCVQCKNFIGAGDWNLCCKNPPESAKDNWCGFLCYEDTPACENFDKQRARAAEEIMNCKETNSDICKQCPDLEKCLNCKQTTEAIREFHRELIQEQHSCG